MKTSFRACSKVCAAGGNAKTPLDFRGMKSQGKRESIADLLALPRRLRKGAVAQISLVHQVTSKSPEAADATGKMNARPRSPRGFCCFAFAESCSYRETPLLI